MTKKEVIEAWEKEICQKANEVDEANEFHWESLFVGFAIGKGLPIEEAIDYKFYINEAFPIESKY